LAESGRRGETAASWPRDMPREKGSGEELPEGRSAPGRQRDSAHAVSSSSIKTGMRGHVAGDAARRGSIGYAVREIGTPPNDGSGVRADQSRVRQRVHAVSVLALELRAQQGE